MRIYLDNAATSWPKPECVYQAVDRYQRDVGAAAGRGAYRPAGEAQQAVAEARQGCAALLGVEDPTRIVFGCNGTDALNLAIHGLLRPGDHVVSTVCEHNSVLRPLFDARDRLGVELTLVGCDAAGRVDPEEVARAVQPDTRLVAATHASNVTGAVQPIAEIGRLLKSCQAMLLVDAAQSLGHLPIDVEELGADLLAASGHKGLLGPLGAGLLYVRPGVEQFLNPIRQGGTGVDSRSETQPEQLPERYEAGNLNVPALAGLAAAATFLLQRGVASVAEHEEKLTTTLIDRLQSIDGIRLIGPTATTGRVGVVSFRHESYEPQELATLLDAAASIQCRAGLHCSPLTHRALGTEQHGGAVRLSMGWSTTLEQIERTVETIEVLGASL